MKALLTTSCLLAGSLTLAHADAKESVIAAAKALAGQDNYSWTTTTEVPEGTRWRPGPVRGRVAQGGPIVVKMSFGDNESEMVIHGKKAAMTNRDGDWESLEEMENSEGGGRFRAAMARSFLAPADDVQELLGQARGLEEKDGVVAGQLTEAGAKSRMTFRRRTGEGGPEISGAKGSLKIWLKEGALVKYQYHVEGVMDWNGNDLDIDRTVTVEIKDIGSTKVEIPEGAKGKLSQLHEGRPSPVRGLTLVP